MKSSDPFEQLGALPERANIARYLPEMAARRPEQKAVVAPDRKGGWTSITYGELEVRSNRIASALAGRGVVQGQRVCLFVRPGVELIALTYAIYKLGAVPVLADPGMGRKRLLTCIRTMKPEVFFGIPMAHIARIASPSAFKSVKIAVTVGRKLWWRGATLKQLLAEGQDDWECADMSASDPAAILFTSGSTGPPKGVLYTQGMFEAQVRALTALYDFEEGEVDLACFPLFALFNTAFGMTSVFPRMDFTRPAKCEPANIVAAIRECGVTTTFGSPAIWRRVVPYCRENSILLANLKRVLIAGAPVPPALIEGFHHILPLDGDVHTPYGATESLPAASISGRELVGELFGRTRSGLGTCVGRAAVGIELALIGISAEPIPTWSPDLRVPQGSIGEICVRGPVVTEEYAEAPEHTRSAKIAHPDGSLWHRMGDLGRLDEEGRLWFLGRKSHRLQTAQGLRTPVPTENVYNRHPRVARSALVGVGAPGAQEAVLIIEPVAGSMPISRGERATFVRELQALGSTVESIGAVHAFLFHKSFPVDVRHNAKIHRDELARWAERKLKVAPAAQASQSSSSQAPSSQSSESSPR